MQPILDGTETSEELASFLAHRKHPVLERALRERAWSQADLARFAGVRENAVSRLMCFRFSRLTNPEIDAIGFAIGIHPESLVPPRLRRHQQGAPIPPPGTREIPFSVLADVGIPEPYYLPAHDSAAALDAEEVQHALESGGIRFDDLVVVFGHFGLGRDRRPMTLKEIGIGLGCTRQRAEQRERRGLHRIRDAIAHLRHEDPRSMKSPRRPPRFAASVRSRPTAPARGPIS